MFFLLKGIYMHFEIVYIKAFVQCKKNPKESPSQQISKCSVKMIPAYRLAKSTYKR